MGNPPKEPEKTDIKCDRCGEPMVIKESRRGKISSLFSISKMVKIQNL